MARSTVALLNFFVLAAHSSYLSVSSHAPAQYRCPASSRRCLTLAQLDAGDELSSSAATADDMMQQQRWDDSSFADESWPPLEPTAVRPEPTRPVQTVTIGRVSGPFKRRRGYHAEVAVQHSGGHATIHRLWFAHEVLQDVARLRGARERHIQVEEFAEATVRFLQEQGVDLANPDWGMDDDSIPFSTEHLPLRTLFEYYDELPAYLAEATLQNVPDDEEDIPIEEAENLARYSHEMEPGVDFPCLGALAPDGSGKITGPMLDGEPVYVDPDTQPPMVDDDAGDEVDSGELL